MRKLSPASFTALPYPTGARTDCLARGPFADRACSEFFTLLYGNRRAGALSARSLYMIIDARACRYMYACMYLHASRNNARDSPRRTRDSSPSRELYAERHVYAIRHHARAREELANFIARRGPFTRDKLGSSQRDGVLTRRGIASTSAAIAPRVLYAIVSRTREVVKGITRRRMRGDA